MTTDLEALDAVATAQLVRSGQASPVEVVQAALTRLQQRNPAINAVIDVWADEALAQARAGVPQGLLAGVPMLLKDTIDHPGHRYAMGSRLRLGTSGRHLDPWVAAMRAEGAIFIGKTNTPEFGLMDVTEPLAFGPTRNPWRHSLASGGSSGGSAAAVAARLVPLAHGSDGGGSIRYPAACCGVFGLKPTRGRTTMPAPAFDARLATHVSTHVLSLTVRDSALALAVADCAMRGPVGGAAQRWMQAPLTRRLRIAQITQPLHGGPLDDAALAAVQRAATLLRSLGHEVQPCAWPIDAPAVHTAFFDRWAYSVFAEVNHWPEAEQARFEQGAEPWSQALRQEGAAMSSEGVEAMVLQCQQASVQMERFHRQWDVLMTPVAAVHGLAVGQHAPDLDYSTLRQRVQHNVAFTPVQNISGQPAMSVPMGWCPDGLPLGVHFAAGAHQDELLLQLACQIEAAQPWAHRRPTTLDQPLP